MSKLIVLFFVILMTENYARAGPTETELGDALNLCLLKAAAYYGRQLCHPPTSMLPAVFGRCSSILDDIHSATAMTDLGKDNDANEVADAAIARIKKYYEESIVTVILDAQIGAKLCR